MPTRFTLTIRETNGSVQQQRVGLGAYYFGRDPECQLVLTSPHVSRRHARVTFEETSLCIEDLNSPEGITVKGVRLITEQRFAYPQSFALGSVTVMVEPAETEPAPTTDTAGVPLPGDDEVRITMTVNAKGRGQLPVHGLADEIANRLEMLYDLPLQFAAEPDLKKLYRLILERVMDLIPGAKRGALLIFEPATGKLAVRASIPPDTAPISRTLIQRAAREQQGFIWGDDMDVEAPSHSMVNLHIRTGMYVPMLWKGQTIGVICVDNPKHRAVFRHEDLQFLISVSHYAAAALANQLLQEDIETNNQTMQHLLANFSPKLRSKLLQKAREGKLQPGGEKSDVTILMCDLRGFTRASASLPSEVVVEMLNDYFSVLGDIIFENDGTIDKFIGDAILAVFGSPEPDEMHALKATRAAVFMQTATRRVNERRSEARLPYCELGIGIDTGEVLHGFIGAKERIEFTVIGDTVNKAARYCDSAAAGEILIGAATRDGVGDRIPLKATSVATKHEGKKDAWLVKVGKTFSE